LSEETWDILVGVMELSKMFETCEMAPLAVVGGKDVAAIEGCSGCGGVWFVPCKESRTSCLGSTRCVSRCRTGAGTIGGGETELPRRTGDVAVVTV
jgi:hypothetical protein